MLPQGLPLILNALGFCFVLLLFFLFNHGWFSVIGVEAADYKVSEGESLGVEPPVRIAHSLMETWTGAPSTPANLWVPRRVTGRVGTKPSPARLAISPPRREDDARGLTL